MAFGHGSKGVFKLDDSAGTLQDLSQYITSVDDPRSADVAEVSTLGVASKAYVPGLKDGTFQLEGDWDPTLDAHMSAILGHADTKTFEYGPAGGASGAVKYTGECIVTGYTVTTGVDDAQKWSATLQNTGDVTRTTFA